MSGLRHDNSTAYAKGSIVCFASGVFLFLLRFVATAFPPVMLVAGVLLVAAGIASFFTHTPLSRKNAILVIAAGAALLFLRLGVMPAVRAGAGILYIIIAVAFILLGIVSGLKFFKILHDNSIAEEVN